MFNFIKKIYINYPNKILKMKSNFSLASSFLPQFTNMSEISLIKNMIKEENKIDPNTRPKSVKNFKVLEIVHTAINVALLMENKN